MIGVHGAADVENGYGTLTVRDAGTGRWNKLLAASSSRGYGKCLLSDNNGSVRAENVSGTLEVRNRFGNITAQSIKAQLLLLAATAPLIL